MWIDTDDSHHSFTDESITNQDDYLSIRTSPPPSYLLISLL